MNSRSSTWMSVILILLISQIAKIEVKSVIRHQQVHKKHRLQFKDNDIGTIFSSDSERKAMEHSIAVADSGACDVPKQQVVHISDHYPMANKYYLPHCTLLHRCGKHAGCCGTDKLRCVAAKKEKVSLYFYSVRVLEQGLPAEQTIERLTFMNHTKCACVMNNAHRRDL